eukprot:6578610-Karenia_brevis.AAC.1
MSIDPKMGDKRGPHGNVLVKVGIPWDPIDFLNAARQCVHPFDEKGQPKEEITEAVVFSLAHGPSAVKKWRDSTLEHYRRRKEELQVKEDVLKAAMDEDVRLIMLPKSLILFKEMMKDAGYDDAELFQDMVGGFPLVGTMTDTGNFEKRKSENATPIRELLQNTKWIRARAASWSGGCGDPELDRKVYEATMDEVDKGWLCGPVEARQLDEKHKKLW